MKVGTDISYSIYATEPVNHIVWRLKMQSLNLQQLCESQLSVLIPLVSYLKLIQFTYHAMLSSGGSAQQYMDLE